MTFHVVHTKNLPIYEQLLLEERLLRSDDRNWCVINEGSTPAIVMGISGKPEELIHASQAKQQNIPLIKRFSGGGTVIVDENTLFITFICQKDIHTFPAYPEPIMKWTEEIYKDVFTSPEFRLRENDYVFGEKKFGGNAQYIKKGRWLHHTSFLWDYSQERMNCLLHPKKTPEYRNGRDHSDFLCRLSDHFQDKTQLITQFFLHLEKRFPLKKLSLEEALNSITEPERQTTTLLPWGE